MQWFPIPSFIFWLRCQNGLHPDSGCCEWFHCFAVQKPSPNPTSSVFIGGFSPRQGNFVVHIFTSEICDLWTSSAVRICACLCVYVCSLPHSPVQGLSLISCSRYHPQWVRAGLKDNLLAYSAPWSALRLIAFQFQMKEPLESSRKSLLEDETRDF